MRLPEPLHQWRNRLLASPRFQDFAAEFPLFRPVAQRKAAKLFDLCAGFIYSQTLYACVELDWFDLLADGPLKVEELAATSRLPPEAANRLARAAAAIDLLEMRDEKTVSLGELGAALLGNRSVFDMVRHHALLYRDLQDPVELLRNRSANTELANFWRYAREEGHKHEEIAGIDYTSLMASTQAFISDEILAAYDFGRHKKLLDVGGGEGVFLERVAKRQPELKISLFDLPSVAARARKRLSALSPPIEATIVPGSFIDDVLPVGADIITLIRILHDHEDDVVSTLLRRTSAALPQGGAVLIAEPIADTKGARAMGDGYFGFYLWAMGSGKPRTHEELEKLLQAAGFGPAKRTATRRPILTSILTAKKI